MEKKTILVVDDAKDVREILKFHLEKKYSVLEASDGRKGLDMIYASHPDLLILDINMPAMSGIDVYSKISSGKGKPLLPVIVLTVREELGTLFRNLDADGFITKPFNIEHVMKEVDVVIAKRYHPATVSKSVKQPGEGQKVLLVDDDAEAVGKIAAKFLEAGYLVSTAKSGTEAFIKTTAALPDLIVIKLELSDIPGDIVCVKFKKMSRTMDVPLVLYSAYSETLDRAVMEKMCKIIDMELIEASDPSVLLEKAKQMLGTSA